MCSPAAITRCARAACDMASCLSTTAVTFPAPISGQNVVADRRHDGGLLAGGPGTQRRGVQARPFGLQDPEVELGPAAALAADDHQPAVGGQRGQVAGRMARAR